MSSLLTESKSHPPTAPSTPGHSESEVQSKQLSESLQLHEVNLFLMEFIGSTWEP